MNALGNSLSRPYGSDGRWRCRAVTLASLVLALASGSPARAVTWWTGAINNDYHNAANWTNGVPSSGNNGTIGVATNNPVMITANTYNVPAIYIANGAGQQGSLTVNNVDFGSSSSFVVELGIAESGGTGVFSQTGASARTYTDYNFIGRSSSSSVATMNILGGRITGMNWRVGGAGTGTLNLANATLTIRNYGARGADQALVVGGGSMTSDNGAGTFNIGDASNPGTVTFERQYDGQGTSVMVRNTASASGTLRGWGTITTAFGYATAPDQNPFGGTLTNNGRVIADGYGSDRDLNLTNNPRGISNTFDNTGNNGWFAVNKGKVLLPTLAVSAGNSALNWGEAVADTTIDLVNSARFTLNNAGGTGLTLSGGLLAVDRTDVAGPAPAGYGFISVHEFATGGFTIDSFNLAIRYDAAQVPDQYEPLLALFQWNGSAWTNMTSNVDTVNKIIYANNLTSFGQFAIGMVPEPSTALLMFTGGWVLWRARRRRN